MRRSLIQNNWWLSGGIIQSLISSGKLVAYYDAKPSNVTVDSARKISQLNDLTGNGHHLTQPTSARRPTYDLVNRITFASASQQYLINNTIVPALQNNSIGIYGVFQSTSSDIFLVNFCDTDGTAFAGLRNSTTLQWGGTLNNGASGVAMNRDNNEQLFGLQINRNVNLNVVENTTITDVVDTLTSVLSDYTTVDNLTIGGRILATPAYSNYFFNSLYITNGQLTSSELQHLVNHINAKEAIYEKIIVAELGQSNMQGESGDTTNPAYPFISGKGRYWTGSAEQLIFTSRGGASGKGSHANYFCERLFDLTGKVAVMVEAATGSTGLTSTSTTPNWSGSSTLRSEAETLIDSALVFYSKASPDYALWVQGESDAETMHTNPAYTKAIVKAAMQDVIDWWQTTYPGVPFIISELGAYDGVENHDTAWDVMRDIQNEIASENTGVYIGFSGAAAFREDGKMIDQFHYRYDGLQEMGEGFANFIATTFY